MTGLSWDQWDPASWERVWIYRKHLAGAAVAGGRVLVTFDGVMTDAIVVLNGWTAGVHVGGYLPWTAELTGHLLPPVPGVPYLISESVGALNPTYRWFDPPAVLANQALAHALAHDQARSDIRYAGILAWAGFDYYSATRNSKNWNTLRTPGVIDTFRVPKPGAAIYQSQADPATRPVIVPVFFWDSRSAPTGPGPGSMFATNCDRLEIFAGGIHLATAAPDRRRFGHLAHPPAFADLTVPGRPLPDLRVHGYTGTRLAAVLLMSADTTRDQLQLTADDATRITFRATDAYGNHRPTMTGQVTLTLTGPAILIGQNPFAFGSYGGVGGAFVRSLAGKTGQVTVTARHATLGSASVQVTLAPAPPGNYL